MRSGLVLEGGDGLERGGRGVRRQRQHAGLMMRLDATLRL